MPVVVKEAFRHDLDSHDQRKVLRCYGCDLPSMSRRCYGGKQR